MTKLYINFNGDIQSPNEKYLNEARDKWTYNNTAYNVYEIVYDKPVKIDGDGHVVIDEEKAIEIAEKAEMSTLKVLLKEVKFKEYIGLEVDDVTTEKERLCELYDKYE